MSFRNFLPMFVQMLNEARRTLHPIPMDIAEIMEEVRGDDDSVMKPYEKKWEGIKCPPLELKVKADFPASHKIHSRPINPRMYQHTKLEFERLCQYMYTPSTSPWASPLDEERKKVIQEIQMPKKNKGYAVFLGRGFIFQITCREFLGSCGQVIQDDP